MGQCKQINYPAGGHSPGTLCDKCGYGPCTYLSMQQAHVPNQNFGFGIGEINMDPQKCPTGYSKTAKAPNAALREIAGRLKSLAFSDMMTFVDELRLNLPELAALPPNQVAHAVVRLADRLETV